MKASVNAGSIRLASLPMKVSRSPARRMSSGKVKVVFDAGPGHQIEIAGTDIVE